MPMTSSSQPEGPGGTTDPTVAALRSRYGEVAQDLLQPLLQLLHLAHQVFEGDLELFYIAAEAALRSAQDPGLRNLPIEDLESGELARLPSLTTNVRSIAASTGIPAETVRRKVALLRERGWLVREHRALSYTPVAAREFAPLRRAIIALAASNYRTVRRVDGID